MCLCRTIKVGLISGILLAKKKSAALKCFFALFVLVKVLHRPWHSSKLMIIRDEIQNFIEFGWSSWMIRLKRSEGRLVQSHVEGTWMLGIPWQLWISSKDGVIYYRTCYHLMAFDGSKAHFTNDFSIHRNSHWWKSQSALIQIVVKWSLWNFAHGNTRS